MPDTSSAAMDITPSVEQTQGNELEVAVEDADDGPTNEKAQTSYADDSDAVKAEVACGAGGCTTGSVKPKKSVHHRRNEIVPIRILPLKVMKRRLRLRWCLQGRALKKKQGVPSILRRNMWMAL